MKLEERESANRGSEPISDRSEDEAELQAARVPRRGYVVVAIAAVLWAASGSSAKYLFQGGVTPYELVQMRVVIASALLFTWLWWRRPDLLRIGKRDVLYFAILGTTGLAMVQLTYFLTISKIKVAAAILLEYLAPIMIALYSVVFARECPTRSTIFAVLGATIGCYLVVGGYNMDLLAMNREGILCGILAAATFAWYSVYGEHGMRRYDPMTCVFYSMAFGSLFWNVAGFFWPDAPLAFASLFKDYSLSQWGLILYISTLGTIFPFALYFEGISLIRSTRASITATLEPITAGFISYLFLGESFEVLQILGGAIVIASVIMLQLRREYDSRTPALIRSSSRQTAETA